MLPGPCAFADWSRAGSRMPTHIALTRQLPAYASSKTVAPPTFATPTRVAVAADPGDGALELVVGRAEPEPVEQRDRPRAHRDDVAQDPADPGRGALERLDGRGVVVRLDLERRRRRPRRGRGRPAFSPGPCRTRSPCEGSRLQERRRVLVAAVLRPEQREDRQLEVVRLAAQELLDSVRLPVGETEGAMERLFRDLRQVTQCSRAKQTADRVRYEGGVSRRYLASCSPTVALLWGASLHVHQGRGARARAGDPGHRPARPRRR